ncbi:MAG: protein kinase [Candidatus Marinimicrobia bacterium]|nr:protein kinase [Candidatus Neomarinimicrobiota bacterium]
MIGKTISHYRILEKLGEGGMGIVYKAEDTKLKRTVALKFLPHHLLANEEDKTRFLHEAQAASALNHPNIMTIHEIDEVDDQSFITMEYIEGETLKDKLEKGPLKTKELLKIAIAVADGLNAAHEQEIVHRDIKSENIMISKAGLVKIMDFGLAKRKGMSRITKVGSTLGTLAYMSPEQAEGSEVDGRSDLFSFGVVMYEMATGQLPFKGEHDAAILYSIVNEAPLPVTTLNPNIPQELDRFIHKALEKEAEDRYQHADDLAADLKKLEKEPAGKIELPPSIAVLPFVNMSADPEQEYFCDGMAEEIINALVNVEGLRVAARTSAFAFKGRQEDIRKIGKALNVETVLEGSVRKARDRLRIIAQLINVSDGYHLWSERYDRELEDVFAIQDEISRAIVDALKIKLRITKEKQLVKRTTENLKAYDTYLRGIYCYNLRTRKDNDRAIQLLEQTAELDPGFALAFASLAYAYIEKFFAYSPQKKWEEKAFVAIEKALSLDPELAEAYVAKGLLIWTKSHHFPHEQAIAEYQRAIAIKPSLAQAHDELARVLWHVGLIDKAHEVLQTAMEINPSDVKVNFRMGMLELQRGNYERALSLLREGPKESIIGERDALIVLSLFYLDRKDEATAYLEVLDEALGDNPEVASIEAICLAAKGKGKEAITKINLVIEKGKNFGHFHHMTNNIAAAYALMNKKKQALDWLEETANDGFPCYPWFEKDPCLQNMRNEPRFKALMKRMRKQWEKLEVKV